MLLLASSVCGLFKWRQFEPEVINAYTMQAVSSEDSTSPFVNKVPKVARVGFTIGLAEREGVRMAIPYEVHDLPIGEPILLSIVPKTGAFLVHNSPLRFQFVQTSGPNPIELSNTHIIEKPVDFEARQVEPPPR